MDAGTVRAGSTNRRAEAALTAETQRFARGEAFDERAMPDIDSEAVSSLAASESFAAIRRLARRDLQTLWLLTDYHGRTVPTAGGILLFGDNRLQSFPDAWIQAGRFDGTNRATIADYAEFNGSLLAGIEQAIAFIEKRALTDADISAVRG
jgi:ATP-dependent DNA helicase RecG